MMNPILVKILAVGMTVSQLFNKPVDEFRPHFDPVRDQAEVAVILGQGCEFLKKELDRPTDDGSPPLQMDELLDFVISRVKNMRASAEAEAAAGAPVTENFATKMSRELDLDGLRAAYEQFCKGNTSATPIDLTEVINYYNAALRDLPTTTGLKGKRLPEASTLFDREGREFTQVYSDDGRRRWVSVADLPKHVTEAFVAVEDQNFRKHEGLDIDGIMRAFMKNLSGGQEGGSTLTQQVIKNLVVGDKVDFDRKMREMVLAKRLNQEMSKDEILELYINMVFLGRASWGLEMAARSYFGKSARKLSISEAALLAGLACGPVYYHVDRHTARALERRNHVLDRMRRTGVITPEEYAKAVAEPLAPIAYVPPRTKGGFYFIDEINRRAKEVAGIPSLTSGAYEIYSTMDAKLQKATELALQNGLFNYEAASGRAEWRGPEGSLTKYMNEDRPTWQEALADFRGTLFDVQWPAATVLSNKDGKVRVGLADGRELPLTVSKSIRQTLNIYDIVRVEVSGEGKNAKATLRIPPIVQGAAVVIENKTGRVLSMSGGFSFAESQLNRVTQTARQPGSTLKPFIYLSAFATGYFQPNTLIANTAPSLQPLRRGERVYRPKNYDRGAGGYVTIRRAVERSLNLPTVRLMAGLGRTPGEGLDYVRSITQHLGIYSQTERVYPFVLGAQPARLIDLAYAYATIANIGLRPQPQFIDTITQNGQLVYQRPRVNLAPVPGVDRVAYYQIRRVLEGTLARGTATAMKQYAGTIAGKTGTSNNENDAWFIGFTNDITVAVWVGYDNRNIRPSLGAGFTGARAALPIAKEIFERSFEIYKQPEPLVDAPEEIRPYIEVRGIDVNTGVLGGKFPEVFRAGMPADIMLRDEETPLIYNQSETNGEDLFPDFGEDGGEFPVELISPEAEQEVYRPGAEDNFDYDLDPLFADPYILE